MLTTLTPIFIIYPEGRWEKVESVNLPGETAAKKEARMFNAARAVVGGDVEMVACIIPGRALLVDDSANMRSNPPLVNTLASALSYRGVSLRGPAVMARVS